MTTVFKFKLHVVNRTGAVYHGLCVKSLSASIQINLSDVSSDQKGKTVCTI